MQSISFTINLMPASIMRYMFNLMKVTLTYDVEYSEGKGTEQFIFQVRGDKALLFNYNVNSPLLITK